MMYISVKVAVRLALARTQRYSYREPVVLRAPSSTPQDAPAGSEAACTSAAAQQPYDLLLLQCHLMNTLLYTRIDTSQVLPIITHRKNHGNSIF